MKRCMINGTMGFFYFNCNRFASLNRFLFFFGSITWMNHDGHFRNSKQAAITDLAKSNLLILIRSSTSYKAIWKKGQKPFFINPKAYPAVIRFDLDDDDDHGSTVLSLSPLLRVEFDSERLCPELSFKRVFLGKVCRLSKTSFPHHASCINNHFSDQVVLS